MTSVPEGVDLRDPRARACWGAVVVTPERLSAWEQWKTDYVVNRMEQFIADGASRDEALHAGALIWVELQSLDDKPWMPLGVAKAHEVAAMLADEVLVGEARLDYLVATRTSVTSTDAERILNLAYNLGLTVQQASKYMTREQQRAFSADEPHAGRTALYRHFDGEGMLLYIGIAKDPSKRSEQHGYHSRWWRFVADTTVEWHSTREAADAAERESIAAERPVFNRTHNRSNAKAATDYLFDAIARTSA